MLFPQPSQHNEAGGRESAIIKYGSMRQPRLIALHTKEMLFWNIVSDILDENTSLVDIGR